jgi:hypothetical protein
MATPRRKTAGAKAAGRSRTEKAKRSKKLIASENGSDQMDRNARINGRASSIFPYDMLKGTPVWKIVDRCVADLVENNDLVETTRREYIVGYICKKLQRVLPETEA